MKSFPLAPIAFVFACFAATAAAQQTIYVSTQGDSMIRAVTTAGGAWTTVVNSSTPITGGGTVGGAPFGMALDASGNLYFANTSTHSILVYSASTHLVSTFATTSNTATYPYGIAFDSSGNLFAAYPSANIIEKFSPAGVDLGNFATTAATPYNIVFSPTGQLLLANLTGNTIVSYAPNGTPTTFIPNTHLSSPEGMTFDASGNLYVANQANNTVAEFTSGGSYIGTFTSAGVPRDLAFDASGNLYAINGGSYNVDKYSSVGASLGVFETTTGSAQPTFIIISPIPEPATIAALMGLGVLGFAALRRRRAAD